MSILKELDETTRQTSSEVAKIITNVSIGSYQHFLQMMYFYTLKSFDRLDHAAKLAKDEKLSKFFSHLALEEKSHYTLAKLDLRAFGKDIDNSLDTSVVDKFNRDWMKVGADSLEKILGILYVLENVANYNKTEAMQSLGKLNIQKDQARFILVHLEADEEHGSLVNEYCSKASDDKKGIIVDGAKLASKFWLDLHRVVFK